MVTKVKNLVQALEYSGNLEQDVSTTTGLTFGYHSGFVSESGTLTSVSASTVVVPAGLFGIYWDVDTLSIKATLLSSLPTQELVLLFTGDGTSGSITNVVDARNFASRGEGGGGPSQDLETFMISLTPTHYWKMDETSGTIADSGSGTARTGTAVGTPVYDQAGPIAAVSSILFDGVNDAFSLSGDPWENVGTGQMSAFVFIDTGFVAGTILGSSNASVSAQMICNVLTNGQISTLMRKSGSGNSYAENTDSPPGAAEAEMVFEAWHHVFIMQDGHQGGMRTFVDGKEIVESSRTLTGSSTIFDWANDVTARTNHGIAFRNASAPAVFWKGRICQVATWNAISVATSDIVKIAQAGGVASEF